MTQRKRVMLDANVVSILADDTKTGAGFLKEQEFYKSETEHADWHITAEILAELRSMRNRTGKAALYIKCRKLLSAQNAVTLSEKHLPSIANREDVRNALAGHDKTKADRRDCRNVCRAIYEKLVFLCHDNELYQRTKNLYGLSIVSFHGQAKKGQKTVKRGRGGSRQNW